MDEDQFLTIVKSSTSEFKDGGSKFLGFAFPVNHVTEIGEKLTLLKEAHPKATHHCYAYKFGFKGINSRANDDGEPSGSAGRPILGQIDSMGMNHVLVVVVRYFGGTKLGVPRLIQAYKGTARLALESGIPKIDTYCVDLELVVDYELVPDIMTIGKSYEWHLLSQAFSEKNQQINIQIRASKRLDFERDLFVKSGEVYLENYESGERSNRLIINEIKHND